VNLSAWCGGCGRAFPLAEVVVAGNAGHCPRCGRVLAPDYTPVLVAAVRDLLAAADALEAAARRVGEVAPPLHIDRRRLCADLEALLDH